MLRSPPASASRRRRAALRASFAAAASSSSSCGAHAAQAPAGEAAAAPDVKRGSRRSGLGGGGGSRPPGSLPPSRARGASTAWATAGAASEEPGERPPTRRPEEEEEEAEMRRFGSQGERGREALLDLSHPAGGRALGSASQPALGRRPPARLGRASGHTCWEAAFQEGGREEASRRRPSKANTKRGFPPVPAGGGARQPGLQPAKGNAARLAKGLAEEVRRRRSGQGETAKARWLALSPSPNRTAREAVCTSTVCIAMVSSEHSRRRGSLPAGSCTGKDCDGTDPGVGGRELEMDVPGLG